MFSAKAGPSSDYWGVNPLVYIARDHLKEIHGETLAAAFNPLPSQESTFQRIQSFCGKSRMGRKLGLRELKSVHDLCDLPTTSFEDYAGIFATVEYEGIRASHLLSQSPVVAFGQSSGSTASPKRIPLTRECLAAYRRASLRTNASLFEATGNWERLFTGKSLFLGARPEIERTHSGLPVGFISGMMMERSSWVMRRGFLPSRELLYLESWDEKLSKVIDEAVGQDVRALVAVPAVALAFAERVLAKTGEDSILSVWPRLNEVLFGGMPLSKPARERFRALWGGPVFFWEMYAATEAVCGHALSAELPGLVFNSREVVFTLKESRADGRLIDLTQAEAGKKYELFITTVGGVINYALGDTIEVLGRDPLMFRVSGREKEEISLGGERITADQAARVAEEIGAVDFAVYPEEGAPNRLVLVLAGPPSSEAGSSFDSGLCRVNPTYREMRLNDFVYARPLTRIIPEGVFASYRSRNLHRGQFKERRLFSSQQDFEAEVL